MGVSMLISAAIFVGFMGAVAAAIATTRVVAKRRQADMAVTFADLPRAAPPKPKALVQRAPGARKTAKRAATIAPKAIPTERPPEAEGELVAAGEVGPVDAIIEAQKASAAPPPPPPPPPPPTPTPPPPEQRRETIEQPKFVSGCRAPEIPEALHSLAATIQIDVRMLIGPDGRVMSAAIAKAHPLIPDELILRCAREQVFEAAHLPDGTAVPYPFHRRFVFKPSRS